MPLISPDIFIHKMFNQMDLSEDETMSYNTQKMSINIVKQASLMWHIYLKKWIQIMQSIPIRKPNPIQLYAVIFHSVSCNITTL